MIHEGIKIHYLLKGSNRSKWYCIEVFKAANDTLLICWISGLRAGLAASIAGSSIISKMLLANIDPFGATPFIDPDPDLL